MMAYTTELGLQMADFYLEEGVDVIVPVDPVVSQISPTHFKNFVFEPYAKIFRHIRNKGAFSSFFVCGNATHILELMCQTKPDSLAVDENVNIVAAHKLTDIKVKKRKNDILLSQVDRNFVMDFETYLKTE